MKNRCSWAGNDPLYIAYHDKEWGSPIHDDRLLFEFLILEGAQAGLSWITILKKREAYRQAFDYFDYEKIARYTQDDVSVLLENAGIIRNRRKIESAIRNAAAFIKVREEFGSFDAYFWKFVNGVPIKNEFSSMAEMPTETQLSQSISKDLKKRGFNFVGPTICYAYMQAVGMVNDHMTHCFRYKEINDMLEKKG